MGGQRGLEDSADVHVFSRVFPRSRCSALSAVCMRAGVFAEVFALVCLHGCLRRCLRRCLRVLETFAEAFAEVFAGVFARRLRGEFGRRLRRCLRVFGGALRAGVRCLRAPGVDVV